MGVCLSTTSRCVTTTSARGSAATKTGDRKSSTTATTSSWAITATTASIAASGGLSRAGTSSERCCCAGGLCCVSAFSDDGTGDVMTGAALSKISPPPEVDPPPQTTKKHGLVWFILLLAIAGVVAYAVWRAGRPSAVARAATDTTSRPAGAGGRGGGRGGAGLVPVVVAPTRRSDVPVYLNGLGNATAFYTVTVKSRVDGQLMKVDFNEGDLVKEGQVLIEIDPRPYQVQLELAQGTLAHDQALLDNAKVDLERYKMLLATDAI